MSFEIQKSLGALPPVRLLSEVLRGFGRPAFLVGGLLRDCALRRSPEPGAALDIDIAVAGSARDLSRLLARKFGGTPFVLDDATRIYRVASKSAQIDVAEIQGKDIEADLARRDFTVNAMALPLPFSGRGLIDPYGGLKDLRRRRLRAVSDRVFQEDPLRLLRAFRLAAGLGLDIDPRTLRDIRPHRNAVRSCAGERIRAELLNLLAAGDAAPWLSLMDKAGLLTALFPELEPARRCAEVYYGKGGVLKHSLDAVSRLDFLLGNLRKVYPRLAPALHAHLSGSLGGFANHCALLRLAVLLHDVAKPECAKKMGGRLRFFGHEARGAEVAESILRRLRFSRDETEMVRAAVLHHLRPGNLAAGGIVTDKAVFRFFRDLGPHGLSLLLLCWADHASYLKPPALGRILRDVRKDPHRLRSARERAGAKGKTLFHLQVVSFLLDRHFRSPATVHPEKLLDGNTVMKTLRIPPGPRVGEILSLLQEAQAESKVKNRREALDFIRSL